MIREFKFKTNREDEEKKMECEREETLSEEKKNLIYEWMRSYMFLKV